MRWGGNAWPLKLEVFVVNLKPSNVAGVLSKEVTPGPTADSTNFTRKLSSIVRRCPMFRLNIPERARSEFSCSVDAIPGFTVKSARERVRSPFSIFGKVAPALITRFRL
jgi:hypothetical protein